MTIYEIIQKLRSDNSRLWKQKVLGAEQNNPVLKQVLFLALNPLKQFHIKKIPDYTPLVHSSEYTLESAIQTLESLSNRTYTGNAGKEWLRNILKALSKEDSEIIELIIGKDLKCGVSTSTVNAIWPGLIPDMPYMRCSLLSGMKTPLPEVAGDNYLISQLKADGSYAAINYTADGEVTIFTRTGNEYDIAHFPAIVQYIKDNFKPDTQTHGEFTVLDAEDQNRLMARQKGNGVLNSVLKGGNFGMYYTPVFSAWDQIPLSAAIPKGIYSTPYRERYDDLAKQLVNTDGSIAIIETRFVYTIGEMWSHYFEQTAKGLEGTIVKSPLGIWKDGTSKEQWKVKVEFCVDLVICGFKPGNGKNESTFGSFYCRTSDGLLEVNVSGISDKLRKEVASDFEKYNGAICSVIANNIMEGVPASLFLPRFSEIRFDKNLADSLQQVRDQLCLSLMIKPKTGIK